MLDARDSLRHISIVPTIRIRHRARDHIPSVVLLPTEVTDHLLNFLYFLICRHLERYVCQ
jgi:hypothetical protein